MTKQTNHCVNLSRSTAVTDTADPRHVGAPSNLAPPLNRYSFNFQFQTRLEKFLKANAQIADIFQILSRVETLVYQQNISDYSGAGLAYFIVWVPGDLPDRSDCPTLSTDL